MAGSDVAPPLRADTGGRPAARRGNGARAAACGAGRPGDRVRKEVGAADRGMADRFVIPEAFLL
eukprot:scaffold5858_cov90-Isochrysis_galbana.AAC.2